MSTSFLLVSRPPIPPSFPPLDPPSRPSMVSAAVKAQRRIKLVSLLTQKMTTKYNTDVPSKPFVAQIASIVDDVMAHITDVNVTGRDLAVIDSRCKSAHDGYERAAGRDPRLVKVARPKSTKKVPFAPASLKNDWVIMDTFEAIENDKSIVEDKLKLKADRADVKRTLDLQMEEKERVRALEREVEAKFLREQQSVMEQWNYETSMYHTMEKGKIAREKSIRDEQCRLNALKKSKRREAEKASERHDVAVCQRELARQVQEKIDRENEGKAQNAENMAAVHSQFGKRERLEREEKESDVRLMKLKIQMMDDEERARKELFNARVSKYEKFSTKYQEAGAGKQKREAELKTERIILRDAAAKEARDIKREVDDINKVKSSAIFLQRENGKAIKLAKAKEKKEKDEDFAHSLNVRMAGEAYTAGAWERAQEEKQKGARYARELMKQKMEIDRRVTKVEMSEVERIMNKKLLLKLQEEPRIVQGIVKKMFEKKKMKESDKFKYGSSLPGFSIPGQDE